MKQIIISLVFLVILPAIAFGANPAPYTEDALQAIYKAIHDSPKAEYPADISKEEFHRRFAEYYSKIFEAAGYSFNDTIDQIVDDMKNNPEAIPSDRQSVYNNLYILLHIMMYECNSNEVDCLQFFPDETKKSIQWLIENSEFSKQGNAMHHQVK